MHLRAALGFGFCISVAIACSSSGANKLAGQPGGDGGSCTGLGTTANDGAGYVKAEGCATCHGQNMAGRLTPLAAGEDGVTIPPGHYLYPPNLTPDQTTGLGKWTDGQINQAITQGIDNQSLRLCPEMGSHYPNMCPGEVTGIIAYLRSIAAVSQVIPSSVCPPLKSGPAPDGG